MKHYLLLCFLMLLAGRMSGQSIRVSDGSPLTVQTKLHLIGATNQSGLRLGNLPYTATATALNRTKFLTVDEEGNVVLGSINGTGRLAAETAGPWQTVGVHVQNSNPGGVIIGEGIINKPEGYNLYVSRGILTERLKVAIKTTDDWSDKVFGPAYVLPPLADVERFIKKFQHLPGIDSAEQVVKEGVDVGVIEAKLLGKIEELTLYLIDQQKALSQLRQENQQMKAQLRQLLEKSIR